METWRPLQNDLEPLLRKAGLSGAAVEILLNLALGPANVDDLEYNAKLLPGEDAADVVKLLSSRGLVAHGSGGDDRFRIEEPETIEKLLPGIPGKRLAHLVRRAELEFIPAVNLNPALPENSSQLKEPYTIYREAFRERLPQLEFRLQTVCNLNCMYCYIRKNPRDSHATAAAEAELRRFRSAGVSRLILTGGEPTIRKDLPRLIRYAREIGFEDVQLFTNGLMFAYKDFLAACIEAGMTSICLHVSSIDREIYRRLTGLDRLATLKEASRNLAKYPQLEMTLLTVVNRLNLENLAETVAYFRTWQERAGFSRFVSQVIFCCVYSNSWDHRDQVLLPLDDTISTMEGIISKHRSEPWPVMFQGFPFCLLPGLEAYSYDLYFTFARQLLPGGGFDFSTLDTMFLKPERCLQCVHEPYCLGLSRGYARLYGTQSLSPQTSGSVSNGG